jgi:hypothetical protein
MTAYMLLRRANIAYRGRDARRSIDLAAAAHQHIDGVDHQVPGAGRTRSAVRWSARAASTSAGTSLTT